MKTFVMTLALALALISSAALADGVNYTYPQGALQAFNCPPTALAQGYVCATQDYFGQTLNDRPLQANVHAVLMANTEMQGSGGVDRIVRLTITKLTDPTDVLDALATLPLTMTAYICSYHRSCYFSTQTANVSMDRTYGQRYFENSVPFDFHLDGMSGAEETQFLISMDISIPGQQYPITLKFTSNY